MEIILIRHGQTEANREKYVQGRSDLVLDQTGRAQAERLSILFRSESLTAVYSSPLRRAVETAEAIARPHALTVTIEPNLVEMDVGFLDGLSYRQMREQYASFLQMWRSDAGSVRMPGGETLREVQDRSWSLFQQLCEANFHGSVAIVSHAFTLQGLLCKVMEIPSTHFERVRHDVAAVTRLTVSASGAIVLKSLNDRCHLLSEPPGWIE